ncbi:MAG: hypothetical protein NC390_03290 [Fusobacterium sp.]|nr:hypothetical protein [Fusobacterium sp.]
MKPAAKSRFRRRYETFMKGVDKSELFDSKEISMPLLSERSMDEFIKTSQIYSKYKDQPIICLGRSPKWFLNASLWTEGGINDYKFVAFSGYWHRPDYREGMVKIKGAGPTEKEELAYRKYLKRIKADPQTIVENMEKTGKKTVITDYICSGKGACSFLDVMAHYADDLGILEKFSKSIQIVGIGSMDYMEHLNPYAETYSEPSVPMPKILQPYRDNIKQTFYDMDYNMFREMLLNQNTNECRSTYYPHQMWPIYRPDRFKIGLIKDKDINKIKQMVKEANGPKKVASHFTPAMFDFRNLLNFRILDALSTRGMLKAVHKSKI